jgi:VWFA-related protein
MKAMAVIVVCACALATSGMRAQGVPQGGATGTLGRSEPPGAAGTTFRATTELVALNVTVTDPKDHYVPGLTRDDFAVYEDGVQQEIRFFAAENVPLDLAIMIDTSASMTDKMAFVHEAAARFVRALRPGDRAEVVGFSNDTRILSPFTDQVGALEDAVRSTVPHGGTALYTSVYIALRDLSRLAKQAGDLRRQAIVVLTDGEDTVSSLSFDDLRDAARRSGVAVYPIAVVSREDLMRQANGERRYFTESDFALRSLAQDTGGWSFFPLQLSDLTGVYEQIGQELRTQYSLAYTPRPVADGAFHKLSVRVLSHPDARTRTRSGYFASHTSAVAALDRR